MKKVIQRMACLLGILFLASSQVYAQDKASLYWVDAKSGAGLQDVVLSPDGEAALRLVASIPAGKLLKAYNITVVYNPNVAAVVRASAAPDASMPPKHINAGNAGTVTLNGFDIAGITATANSPLIDLTVRGIKAGTFDLIVAPNSFGSSVADQFIPLTETIRVTVR